MNGATVANVDDACSLNAVEESLAGSAHAFATVSPTLLANTIWSALTLAGVRAGQTFAAHAASSPASVRPTLLAGTGRIAANMIDTDRALFALAATPSAPVVTALFPRAVGLAADTLETDPGRAARIWVAFRRQVSAAVVCAVPRQVPNANEVLARRALQLHAFFSLRMTVMTAGTVVVPQALHAVSGFRIAKLRQREALDVRDTGHQASPVRKALFSPGAVRRILAKRASEALLRGAAQLLGLTAVVVGEAAYAHSSASITVLNHARVAAQAVARPIDSAEAVQAVLIPFAGVSLTAVIAGVQHTTQPSTAVSVLSARFQFFLRLGASGR